VSRSDDVGSYLLTEGSYEIVLKAQCIFVHIVNILVGLEANMAPYGIKSVLVVISPGCPAQSTACPVG
jgi:hypothetical protein